MRTSQQVVDQPKLQQKFQLRRFLWSFTAGWYKAKKGNKLDQAFWDKQSDQLIAFDKGFPGHYHGASTGLAVEGPAPAPPPVAASTSAAAAAASPPPPPAPARSHTQQRQRSV